MPLKSPYAGDNNSYYALPSSVQEGGSIYEYSN